MKKLVLLLLVFTTPLIAQQKEKAIHLLFQNVDTSYFDEDGYRWHEFSMPIYRTYTVMELFSRDTTCNCDVLWTHKDYIKYLKVNDLKRVKGYDRKVDSHLVCDNVDNYFIILWLSNGNTFGMIRNIKK
jgi:hypothetical protein